MGRKTNRQRGKRKGRVSEDGPFFTRSPLSDIPKDVLKPAIIEMGKKAASSLPEIREKVIAAFERCSPLYFLTGIAQSALMTGVREDGSFARRKGEKKLEQFHVELAQALFLSFKKEDVRWDGLRPQAVQECADLIYDYSMAFQQSRLAGLEGADEESLALLNVQERIRLHTVAVRNWGYYLQVIEILKKLYSPLDAELVKIHGVTATGLIDTFDYILRSIERESNIFMKKMRKIFSHKKNNAIIRAYHEEFELKNADKFCDMAANWSHQQLMLAIVTHAQLLAEDIYTFSRDELDEEFGSDGFDADKALSLLSIPFGGLADYEKDRLFLSNPVWEKPIISSGDGIFHCFMPQLFFSHSFHIFGNLFDGDAKAKVAHATRRAKFLEEEIAKSFQGAFGDHTLETNVKWQQGDDTFESDLLIVIDTRLFIVEAKSHRISWPALRGAPDRVKRHVKELLLEPALQADRLKGNLERMTRGEGGNFRIFSNIDFSSIKHISTLSITLDDFATIQSNLQPLCDAGLIGLNAPLSVSMSLADLQSIFHILESDVERMHYLTRREELQHTLSYLADELDLLGVYLQTGFDLGEAEAGHVGIVSVGMSETIDHYFQLLDQGLPASKPKRKMTPWFQDMKDRLSAVRPRGWTEAASMLMSVGIDDQKGIERHFTRVRNALKKVPPSTPGKLNTTAVIPPAWRKHGLAFVAFHEAERQDRHAIMENSSLLVFEQSNAEQCLVVACDLNGLDYPYSTLGVFERPADLPASPSPDAVPA